MNRAFAGENVKRRYPQIVDTVYLPDIWGPRRRIFAGPAESIIKPVSNGSRIHAALASAA
jgi:hypothetical protein